MAECRLRCQRTLGHPRSVRAGIAALVLVAVLSRGLRRRRSASRLRDQRSARSRPYSESSASLPGTGDWYVTTTSKGQLVAVELSGGEKRVLRGEAGSAVPAGRRRLAGSSYSSNPASMGLSWSASSESGETCPRRRRGSRASDRGVERAAPGLAARPGRRRSRARSCSRTSAPGARSRSATDGLQCLDQPDGLRRLAGLGERLPGHGGALRGRAARHQDGEHERRPVLVRRERPLAGVGHPSRAARHRPGLRAARPAAHGGGGGRWLGRRRRLGRVAQVERQDCGLYAYELSTGREMTLAKSGGANGPEVVGDWIVWNNVLNDAGTSHYRALNLVTGGSRQPSPCSARQSESPSPAYSRLIGELFDGALRAGAGGAGCLPDPRPRRSTPAVPLLRATDASCARAPPAAVPVTPRVAVRPGGTSGAATGVGHDGREAELLQTSRPEPLDDELDAQRKLPQRDRECDERRHAGAYCPDAEQRGEVAARSNGAPMNPSTGRTRGTRRDWYSREPSNRAFMAGMRLCPRKNSSHTGRPAPGR